MPASEKFKKKASLPAWFSRELSGYYDEREAGSLARWVLEDLTGKSSLALLTGRDEGWNNAEIKRIEEILDKLRQGDPVQYILGYTEFFGLRFAIGPGVLIPRNETEELVEWVLSDQPKHNEGLKILDIGCGSGAIAVSLSKNMPLASVYGVDISETALEATVNNAEYQGARLCCGLMDILEPRGFFNSGVYDVIVSNPPYVLESQKPFLEKRVAEKEPSMALFVPDFDPLIFYKAIAAFAKDHLKEGGSIYVEINEQLAYETKSEFEQVFSFTELRRDINGKNRMIKATNGKE